MATWFLFFKLNIENSSVQGQRGNFYRNQKDTRKLKHMHTKLNLAIEKQCSKTETYVKGNGGRQKSINKYLNRQKSKEKSPWYINQ